MACNCKHMEREITEYKAQIEALRELFIRRMTVDSETTDRRRRDYNRAIFGFYERPDGETYQMWDEIDMGMVLRCFDDAVKDWRRTFCDVESCRRK